MKEEKEYKHECLKVRGNGLKCTDCRINELKFCPDMINSLETMDRWLNKNYDRLPFQAHKEILSQTVIAVWKGIDSFKGNSSAYFSAWVWRIFRNKVTDYLRQEYRENEIIGELFSEDDVPARSESDENREIEHIIIVLKEKLTDNNLSECVRLFLDLYTAYKEGKTETELAAEYGIKANTLHQRKKRCKKAVRELFQ